MNSSKESQSSGSDSTSCPSTTLPSSAGCPPGLEHNQGSPRLGQADSQAFQVSALYDPQAAPSTLRWTSHSNSRQDSLRLGAHRTGRNTTRQEMSRRGRLPCAVRSRACELRRRPLCPSRGFRSVAALRCLCLRLRPSRLRYCPGCDQHQHPLRRLSR